MTRSAGIARGPGYAGMTAVLVGGVAVLIAIVALDWYDAPQGIIDTVPAIRFHTLSGLADQVRLPWLASAYFGWLVWIMLIGVIVVGMLANAPTPAAGPLRLLGFLLGAGGAALTYYALDQLMNSAFRRADVGVWVTLAGFIVAALGAVIGPRRI